MFHGGTNIRKHFQTLGPRLGQWLKGLDQKVHDKPKQWHGIWDFGPQDYDESKFTDHVTATWVADQLGNKHDKPFFLAFGFYRPHVPFFPPRRVYDSFEDVQLPRVDAHTAGNTRSAAAERNVGTGRRMRLQRRMARSRGLLRVACVRGILVGFMILHVVMFADNDRNRSRQRRASA